jgi:hypothetical protein
MFQLQQLTDKIKRMTGLSIFAKFDLFNKFVTSKVLYAAEFIYTPPSIVDGIHKMARKLLPPDAPCWKNEAIQSRADLGGLGMLPFREHIKARQYKWLIKLLMLGTTTVWSTLVWNATAHHRRTNRPTKVMALRLLTQPCDLPGVHPALMEYSEDNEIPLRSLINVVFRNPTEETQWNYCWHRYKGNQLPLHKYTVKEGTRLITINSADPIRWQQATNNQIAWIHTVSEIRPRFGKMLGNIRKWWRARVPNPWKEIIWHINSGGLLVSHLPAERRKDCACGHSKASIDHYARECPIAKHVYSLLKPESMLAGTNSHFQLLLHNIWSNTSPQDVDDAIWTEISIITINALDVGRKTAYRLLHHSTTAHPPQAQDIIRKASHTAEQYFWELLKQRKPNFPPPAPTMKELPFLIWQPANNRWVLQKPLVWTLTRNRSVTLVQ